jgi:hypothetical protein
VPDVIGVEKQNYFFSEQLKAGIKKEGEINEKKV